MTTDSHIHFVPPGLLDNPLLGERAPSLALEHGHHHGIQLGGRHIDSIVRDTTRTEAIIADGAARGVDHHVLSPWVAMIPIDLPAKQAAEICRFENERMAEAASSDASLWGLAAVPLQDPDLALEVLREALALGLKGVELTTAVGGTFIGDARFDSFWQGAAELGSPVFIHPSTRGIDLDPFKGSYTWNSVGNPMETTVAASQLIMRGVLERHPALRILLAHGGGALPALIGRMDHSFDVRPEPPLLLTQRPSVSFAKLYFDTVTHDEELLRSLVQSVGADHVLYGTDYPFDMGSFADPAELGASWLPSEDRHLILSANASSFFDLS